ncbi:MAG: N-acetylglucosamine-6-phosphate deacetylase [Armatimonadota bacterium]
MAAMLPFPSITCLSVISASKVNGTHRKHYMNALVDIQLNGFLGIDFSSDELTLEDIRRVTRHAVSRGTAAYCPTVCTGPMEMYQRNLQLFATAMREPDLAGHILGLHLEGPFISPEPGARGAHQPEFVRRPSVAEFKQFLDWADGRIAILTVAPGEPGVEELIGFAVSQGVVVSLGHHYASDEALQRAVDAGATSCTHLGNGIPNQIDRHHNPIWWQLGCDSLWAAFITDGHHLPAPMIKVALRAKGVERSMVTSDASALAGMSPGSYQWMGKTVLVEPNGRIHCPETGGLAGSGSGMIECMNHLASLGLLSEEDMWKVGRDNPLKLIGKSMDDLKNLDGPDVIFDGVQFVVGKENR